MELQWDHKKYSTGFAHIDEQHKELFDGVNGLIQFLKLSSVTQNEKNKEKLIEMLDFLGNYALTHFQDEEDVFEKYDHPMKETNKEAHKLFLEKYVHYQERLEEKLHEERLTRGILIQIHIFLQSWLVNHILKVDTSLRDCAERAAEQDEEELQKQEEATSRGVFARFSVLLTGNK